MNPPKLISVCILSLSTLSAEQVYHDEFDNDGITVNNSSGGGAFNNTIKRSLWADDGSLIYNNGNLADSRKALFYSENAFQSDDGFELIIKYNIDELVDTLNSQFSFGLVSSETDLGSYTGENCFSSNTEVYSIGVNLIAGGGVSEQGLVFTDSVTATTLGYITPVFDSLVELSFKISPFGAWTISQDDELMGSGQIADGFDLSKAYHIAVFGQGAGSSKSIESIELNTIAEVKLGERADWMRGTWGLNWKPTLLANGRGETLSIDSFLDQVSELKTLDYIQLHLGESYVYSPSHLGPLDLLESLWLGDTSDDTDGDADTDEKPINLIVPRASAGIDPFLEMLKATKAAGLKTQVYVNSSQMLERTEDTSYVPDDIPNITERWKAYCDTNAETQAFINSKDYHTNDLNENRPYMFCYAEFVLKKYAILYGDLIDAWLFDSAKSMSDNGDSATDGNIDNQRIYEAFANAVHAGNPNAAVSFNNGPGSSNYADEENPFSPATLFDDYMFGHPFQGGKLIGDKEINETLGNSRYDRNYSTIQWMTKTSGNIHSVESNNPTYDWDDKVVGHWDPPMSTSAWNGGSTAALTNDEFLLWNLKAMKAGGAMSWGAPLINDESFGGDLLIQDWGMEQLTLMDAHLAEFQSPGVPNWARQTTELSTCYFGQAYSHTLIEGSDFWDPENDDLSLILVDAPSWLSLEENNNNWVISGFPTDDVITKYTFTLIASDASNSAEREVTLEVAAPGSDYPVKSCVDISAEANISYAIDEVVTMTSDIQTAPDGLATFQISFDVTPNSGDFIFTEDDFWGIGADGVFIGSEEESVKSVDNIRVVNFSDNGSLFSAADIIDLSFGNATLVNAQSTNDSVQTTVNNTANGTTKPSTNPGLLDLKTLGTTPITSFVIGVGTSADDTKNKWSIQAINVCYEVSDANLITSNGTPYYWLDLYGLVVDGDYELADLQDTDGDGWPNSAEYIAGTTPKDATSVTAITSAIHTAGGLNIVWNSNSSRTYTLMATDSLETDSWSEIEADIIATSPANTYRISDVSDKKKCFYRIEVQIAE